MAIGLLCARRLLRLDGVCRWRRHLWTAVGAGCIGGATRDRHVEGGATLRLGIGCIGRVGWFAVAACGALTAGHLVMAVFDTRLDRRQRAPLARRALSPLARGMREVRLT